MDVKEVLHNYQISKAWYGALNLELSDIIDEINIGFYHPEGETTGEFSIRWEQLNGNIVPKLVAFDDGWNALNNFRDLLDEMAKVDDENITPDEMNKILVSLGIEDMTQVDYLKDKQEH